MKTNHLVKFKFAFLLIAGLGLFFNACESDEKSSSTPQGCVDADGNVYQTKTIGQQEWMTENLRTTTYNDGTPITLIEDSIAWSNLATEAYAWYKNDSVSYADTYGALYNYYAVETGMLCPSGWHVPSDDEWKQLEMVLGMSQNEADTSGYRSDHIGSVLAANAALWNDGTLENNPAFDSLGFNGLPAGYRFNMNGDFQNMSIEAYFGTSTESDTLHWWMRGLNYDQTGIIRLQWGHKNDAFSIRCVRD